MKDKLLDLVDKKVLIGKSGKEYDFFSYNFYNKLNYLAETTKSIYLIVKIDESKGEILEFLKFDKCQKVSDIKANMENKILIKNDLVNHIYYVYEEVTFGANLDIIIEDIKMNYSEIPK